MGIPDLERRVKQILTNRLGIPAEEITSDAKLVDDLGMDSLDAVELAIATERQFDVAVSDEELAKLATVADIMILVQRLADEQGGPGRGGGARSPGQAR
jgi:acyl carrier protein